MFKVGDKVTTKFLGVDTKVIREITEISKDHRYGSGYQASADGGETCPHCGHTAQQIYNVDAAWFTLAE